jgi:hypothetical protein
MAISFQRVQSGDLITANLMNQIMAAIESLDARSATGPTTTNMLMINKILPSSSVQTGDKIQIVGTGFDNTPALNLVSIGGVPVTVEGGSSTLIIVTVPATPGPVLLVVSNTNGTTSFPLTVTSAGALQAQMLVSNTGGPSDPKILQNKTYTYQFTATIFTSKDETFLFSPSVDLGWTAVATPTSKFVSKTLGNTGTPVLVSVDVTIPNNTPDTTKGKLTLEARSQSNGTLKNSGSTDITVGAAAIQPTSDFTVAFANSVDGSASIANDGVVELPKNATLGEIDFQATFTSAAQGNNAKYDVTTTLDNSTGWTIVQTNPPGFSVGVVPSSFSPIAVQLKGSSTAVPTNLNIKVSLHSDPTKFNIGSQKIRAV